MYLNSTQKYCITFFIQCLTFNAAFSFFILFFLLAKKYVMLILEAVLSCVHFVTKSALSGSSTLRVFHPG